MISLTPLTNLTSAVPWGLWVVIYVWFIGISAGSLLFIAWINSSGDKLHLKNLSRPGICLALAALLAGMLSILIDLGHIERFYKLFISPSPTSVMAWMVWIYGIYAGVLALLLINLKKGITQVFWKFAFLFALALIVMESLLFALPPGKLWHSPIFSLHFLTSSLGSAITSLILVTAILRIKSEKPGLLEGLSRIALPVIIVNLCVEIIDAVYHGAIGHIERWVLLLSNIFVVTLLLRRRPGTITFAGCLGLITILLSKYSSLVSSQLIEPFKGFSQVYIERRLAFSYAPNMFEFFASVLLIVLAAGIFYLLYKILPMTREE
jgi:molybdopterin-containing oxidoreductase family membrane subunit